MKFATVFATLLAAASAVAAVPWAPSNRAVAPVPVTKLVCDGSSFLCTGSLDFGDGNWIAQWSASVFDSNFQMADIRTLRALSVAPVPVTALNCDGSSFLCTANLDFGDGHWVAQWPTAVIHNSFGTSARKGELHSLAPVPANNLVCDGSSFKCTANLDFGDGNWIAQWSTAVIHNTAFLTQN